MKKNSFFSSESFYAIRVKTRSFLRSERGGLVLNGIIRIAILIFLVIIFLIPDRQYTDYQPLLIGLSLGLFLLYNLVIIIWGYIRSTSHKFFLKRNVKSVQVVVEILFYTAFFVANRDQNSAMIFFYLIPTFMAARYTNTSMLLPLAAFYSAAFLFGLALIPGLSSPILILSTAIPRLMVMWLMTWFFSIRSIPSVKEDILPASAPLASILQLTRDGVFIVDNHFRLVFVNEVSTIDTGTFYPRRLSV